MATLTEHSEQAFEEWLSEQPIPMVGDKLSLPEIERLLRAAFDRGMAERRITDRETLVDSGIAREVLARLERTIAAQGPDSIWVESRDAIKYLLEELHLCHVTISDNRMASRESIAEVLLLEEGSEWSDETNRHYELADAILALPSTPITSTREALAEALWNAHHQGGIPWAKADKEERDYAFARADDLLASGLVKDTGDDSLSPEQRDARKRVDAALAEMTNRVDRLAVIREEERIDLRHPDGSWKTNYEIRAEAAVIRSGGVAPVEEKSA